ncbi:radical SAM family heme chaperone HemW [Hanamia caeni]|uniref:Heme chaperone HemW n=1 Tax=Hanamia caeni TaxID=2294116 RepID=A0A3M9N9Y3_9BACT|nr:radical SAM family heme chaperone HemW [Hanamia caeni]RNI34620.1 radical SAM family heme chaperone HemW [Hanamia caeni]
MAGIYIHIPFCRQACFYCNFHFSTSIAYKKEMCESLVKEIILRGDNLKQNKPGDLAILSSAQEKTETIYFGGGTPSLLDESEIGDILDAIQKNYNVDADAEITLEANPDDINEEKLFAWKKSGINRLSIGIQSFVDRDLVWMNRAHNAAQALQSITLAKDAGFDNFSIDLIFGTPGLPDDEWQKNIAMAVDLDIPHISSYALTVEPKTALQKMIELKKKENTDNEAQARQFVILMNSLRNAGYEHYEISNFAKPGHRSRHNSSYWKGEKYIGIGPSAHSFNGNERSWNKANNIIYIKSLQQNIIPFEKEILTEAQKLNEYIMTSLRTMEGMDLDVIEKKFSVNEKNRIENLLHSKVKKEYFLQEKNQVTLTDEGKLFADFISVTLFADSNEGK